jgi:hypothetical protein
MEYPPYHASQVNPRLGCWFFMLLDGRVIGGTEIKNHHKMMGAAADESLSEQAKKDFVLKNKLLRVCGDIGADGRGKVYVEFYETMIPNEAQTAALATLTKVFNGPLIWDMWLTNSIKGSNLRSGEGSINQFLRFLENGFTRTDMKRFKFVFRYTNRSIGPHEIATVVKASTLPVGLGKAGRKFWKQLDRKARFDTLKDGVSIAISVSE